MQVRLLSVGWVDPQLAGESGASLRTAITLAL